MSAAEGRLEHGFRFIGLRGKGPRLRCEPDEKAARDTRSRSRRTDVEHPSPVSAAYFERVRPMKTRKHCHSSDFLDVGTCIVIVVDSWFRSQAYGHPDRFAP